MKQIIFNGGILRNKNVYGVQRYTTEVLRELDSMVDKGMIKVLVPSTGDINLQFKNIEVVQSKRCRINKIQKLLWDQYVFPHYAKKMNGISVDLVVALPLKGCDICAIYDCRTILFPNNAKSIIEKLKRYFYIFRVRISTKRSKYIVTDSESAKADICRLFNCPKDKVKVVYGAWQHFDRVEYDESVIDDFNLADKEYFFTLGSQMRHKNIRWIVSAALQNPHYTFVVTGNNHVNEFDDEIRDIKADNLIYTGYLSDEKVKSLMKHCKAFIQPSIYEGFGIPPMEAMSVGAKCMVSNVSSLPEVYPKSVWYIDPYNYENIDIEEIISKPVEDNQQLLDMYSWFDSAIKIRDLIEGLR